MANPAACLLDAGLDLAAVLMSSGGLLDTGPETVPDSSNHHKSDSTSITHASSYLLLQSIL